MPCLVRSGLVAWTSFFIIALAMFSGCAAMYGAGSGYKSHKPYIVSEKTISLNGTGQAEPIKVVEIKCNQKVTHSVGYLEPGGFSYSSDIERMYIYLEPDQVYEFKPVEWERGGYANCSKHFTLHKPYGDVFIVNTDGGFSYGCFDGYGFVQAMKCVDICRHSYHRAREFASPVT